MTQRGRAPQQDQPRAARGVRGDENTVGPAVRGVLREIDQQLQHIEQRLHDYEPLLAERDRLLAARNAITGHGSGKSGGARISQDDIATYLTEHPGSLPAQIARDLDVPVTNVSQHLYRSKDQRFERRKDGWYVRGA